MNKQTIITILFALVAMVGQAQEKEHDGTYSTDPLIEKLGPLDRKAGDYC